MSVTLNKKQVALMVSLVAATLGEAQFMMVSQKESAPLVDAGFAETNPSEKDGDKIATRATAAGIAAYPPETKTEDSTEQQTGEQNSQDTAAQQSTGKPSFAIMADVEMPDSKRGGRTGTESYPFEKLQKGQSFFVPATEKRPNPAKALASTVTSANNRYAEEVPGETRVNRKGNTVPVLEAKRKFEIRNIPNGEAWGHAGVAGAAVWRTL